MTASRSRRILGALVVLGASTLSAISAHAQTVTPAFASAYSLVNLGSIPALPTQYGGLAFLDNDTILIGGAANTASGRLYTIDVTRNAQGHVTGFAGTLAPYGQIGEYNDGGVVFGPGGVLFTAQWPVRKLGQTKPGSTNEDKVIDLAALGLPYGPGGVMFVPAGLPGAGQLKIVAYDDYKWYTVTYTPDGLGTYTLSAPVNNVTLQGGPEGIAYVPPGSALFPNPSVLVSEYRAGQIGVYEVDGNGNPIVSTRQTFVSSLSGAEGAVIDPVTGDFLFSTFGGANQVIRVSGFQAPAPPITITGTVTDPGAAALAGVTMTLGGSATATTTTSANGTYAFTGLTSGGSFSVTPSVTGRTFQPSSRSFPNMTGNQVADFVGTLVFSISGQVRDLNDTGVPGVTMTVSGSTTGTLTTDIDGHYSFTGLPIGGTYTVTPSATTFAFTPASQTFPNLQKDEVASFFVAQIGTFTRYFAEGATGFFDTAFALLNATGTPSTATLTFQRDDGWVGTKTVVLGGLARATVDPKQVAGFATAAFSTVVTSDQPVIADRTMTWDASAYGSHAETSIAQPQTIWYLAEGATHSNFQLFYLIQNPGSTQADVEITYLRPAPLATVVKTYAVAGNTRKTVWVNLEGQELVNMEVSAVIRSTNSVPVIVERAMYKDVGSQIYGAGHESAGVPAPATSWYLAEGATGDFFDLFILLANPNPTPALVEIKYLLPGGSVVTNQYVVTANSRRTVWVDLEGGPLTSTAVSAQVTSINQIPIIVERAMWWPFTNPQWYEGHNSAGTTVTGEKWGLADGEVGGPDKRSTYVLVANTSNVDGQAQVTLVFEDGTTAVRNVDVKKNSRTNVDVAFVFQAELAGRPSPVRFGTVVESLGTPAPQIVVERAMYRNLNGAFFAAGSDVVGTRLR